MPFVIYAFALSTFALGLSEFIVIGLAPSLAQSFSVSVSAIGATVTAYAFGVCVGGAILTGLIASWTRRLTLLCALGFFTLAHIVMVFAPNLATLVGARFAAGISHGVFLAVASSAAAAAAGKDKAGRAVALVFSGLTIALVLGVPLGTFLDGVTGWRPLLLAVSLLSLAGCAALASQLPRESKAAPGKNGLGPLMEALRQGPVVMVAAITSATYSALFTVYTYIATLLHVRAGFSDRDVSIALLIFGAAAVAGNALGGLLRDALGSHRASMAVVVFLLATLLCAAFWTGTPWLGYGLVAALGFAAFAAVSIFQARIIETANEVAPNVVDVASGLNIAGFNLGIVIGSVVGGTVLSHWGAAHLASAATCLALVALALLLVRIKAKSKTPSSQQTAWKNS